MAVCTTADLRGCDRGGIDASLLHQEHQQHDQRPHRADQHGEKRKQRNADLLTRRLATHAARPLTCACLNSRACDSGTWPSRVVSKWIAAARLMTVSSKFFAPASAAKLSFRVRSSCATSPAARIACVMSSPCFTISCCWACSRRAFCERTVCHCSQRCASCSVECCSHLASCAASWPNDCVSAVPSAVCICSLDCRETRVH